MRNNIIILVLSLIAVIVAVKSCESEKSLSESRGSVIEEQKSTIEEIILEGNNRVAFEKKRAVAEKEVLLESYGFLEDSLQAMGIEKKNLESALFLSQRTQGSGTGRIDTLTVVENDTVYTVRKLNVEEPFFRFSATLFPSNEYNYQYDIYDSLSIINTSGRKNIFNPIEHKVRVVNANQKTTITGVTDLTIKEKPRRIVIGPVVGYGFTSQGLSPYLGVGVTWKVISF